MMNNPSISGSHGPGPGAVLRRKREELGWSVQQIAESLRLSRAQIEAIEADDFDSLPGRTYVLGYWKNYSRLLEIPFDDVIAANREKLRESSAGISLNHEYRDQSVKGDRSRRRAATLIALLLIGFLVGIWYLKNNGRELERFALSPSMEPVSRAVSEKQRKAPVPEVNFTERSSVDNAVEEAGTEAVAPVPVNTGGEGDGSVEQGSVTHVAGTLPPSVPRPNLEGGQGALPGESQAPSTVVAAQNAAQTDPVADAAVVLQSQAEVVADSTVADETAIENAEPITDLAQGTPATVSTLESPVETSSPLDLDSWAVTDADGTLEGEPAPVAAANQQTAVTDQPNPTPTPDPTPEPKPQPARPVQGENLGQVTVTAFKKTWLDVRDSENKRLVNRTVSRGTVLKLEGKPPFSFFVGSPDGVHVVYSGRVVRYQADTSAKFARFSVGSR